MNDYTPNNLPDANFVENPPTNYHLLEEATASQHPVLTALKAEIEQLKSDKEALQKRHEFLSTQFEHANTFKNRVEAVLRETIAEEYDQDTITTIAGKLDIDLSVSTTYEVNVTFTIEVEHGIDEEIDPDWDFDFSVDHKDIQDYSSDVIWSKVVS